MYSYEELASDTAILLSASDTLKLLKEHGIDDLTTLIGDGITARFNGKTYEFSAPAVMNWLGY